MMTAQPMTGQSQLQSLWPCQLSTLETPSSPSTIANMAGLCAQ